MAKLKDYTVIGIYGDNQQPWMTHVKETSPLEAAIAGINKIYDDGKNGPELEGIFVVEVIKGTHMGILDPHAHGLPDEVMNLKSIQTARNEKDQDRLDIFIASDQPEVCRYCGKARTNFKEVGGRQLHTCPECGRSYWVEEETE